MNSHFGTAPLLSVADLVEEKCWFDDGRMKLCRDGGGWRRLPAASKVVVATNLASRMELILAEMRRVITCGAADPQDARPRARREHGVVPRGSKRCAHLQPPLVRLGAGVVTEARLLSYCIVCTDHKTFFFSAYKAIGRNFASPTGGSQSDPRVTPHHNSARRVKTRKTRDLRRRDAADAWSHTRRIKSRIRDEKRVTWASR